MHLGLHNGDVLTSRADEFRSKVLPGANTQRPVSSAVDETSPQSATPVNAGNSNSQMDISVESLSSNKSDRPNNPPMLGAQGRPARTASSRFFLSDLRNRFRRKKLESVPADSPSEASDSGEDEEWERGEARGRVTDTAEVVADHIWRVGILYQVLVFCVGLTSGILVSSGDIRGTGAVIAGE